MFFSSPSSSQILAQNLLQTRQKGLEKLHETLKRDRYAMVDSSTIMKWLDADLMSHGTNTREEIPTLQRLWTECPSQRSEGSDIIYHHKKVFHSRYQLDQDLQRETYDIVTDADGTQRQEYNAHNSTSTDGVATQHYKRFYPALPEKWDDNRLLGGARRLFADVAATQRELGMRAPFGSIVYQFCYRTEMDEHYRDPGPEGSTSMARPSRCFSWPTAETLSRGRAERGSGRRIKPRARNPRQKMLSPESCCTIGSRRRFSMHCSSWTNLWHTRH